MPFEGNGIQCDGLKGCYEPPCYENRQATLASRPELMAVFCAKGISLPDSTQSTKVLANMTPTNGTGAGLTGASTFVDEYLMIIDAFDALAESDLAHFGK